MNRKIHELCTHGGLAFAILLGVGLFVVAGWMPPVRASWDATTIARLFAEDRTRIRIGVSLLALGSVCFWPFSAAIAAQLRRIEGAHPVLAPTQLACASGTVVAAILPAYLWLALALRSGAPSPGTMQVLNDFSWICFVGMYPPALMQNVAIGLAILNDRSSTPRYPRWVGHLNLWTCVEYAVGAGIPFATDGLFAWDGILGFWLAAVSFFVWLLVMWWATLRAIRSP